MPAPLLHERSESLNIGAFRQPPRSHSHRYRSLRRDESKMIYKKSNESFKPEVQNSSLGSLELTGLPLRGCDPDVIEIRDDTNSLAFEAEVAQHMGKLHHIKHWWHEISVRTQAAFVGAAHESAHRPPRPAHSFSRMSLVYSLRVCTTLFPNVIALAACLRRGRHPERRA